jgi:hypothetical protein
MSFIAQDTLATNFNAPPHSWRRDIFGADLPRKPQIPPAPEPTRPAHKDGWEGMTLFHEPWWLDAATGGQWTTLNAYHKDRVVGILPVWKHHRWGFWWWTSPPLTHVLGPVIDLGEGNSSSRRQQRLAVSEKLLAQIPQGCCFRQTLDPSAPDVLAFQVQGFVTAPHYTILIDCADLDKVWAGFRQSTRRFIRKAQGEFEVETWNDPKGFVDFYIRNRQGEPIGWRTSLDCFEQLYAACREKDQGGIYVARDSQGRVAAAVFAAWGRGKLYYLMTTRNHEITDFGVVSLIIWKLAAEANARGLTLDLDGIISDSILKFLTGFGGAVVPRMIVERYPRHFNALKSIRTMMGPRRQTLV